MLRPDPYAAALRDLICAEIGGVLPAANPLGAAVLTVNDFEAEGAH